MATPNQDAVAWSTLFGSLGGRPEVVVCDNDGGIINGVRDAWGTGRGAVPVHRCEHHLYERARQALDGDGITAFGHVLHFALNDAFKTPADWRIFYLLAAGAGGKTARWARHWNKTMKIQTAQRASIPPRDANGAVEDATRLVRQMLERRSWTFRNEQRMNLLLELVRLRINGQDSERAYHKSIRDHLQANHGRPSEPWRALTDPRQRGRRVSTSSLRHWVA